MLSERGRRKLAALGGERNSSDAVPPPPLPLGAEEVVRREGAFLQFLCDPMDVLPAPEEFRATWRYALEQGGFDPARLERCPDLAAALEVGPEGFLFLDLETSGLGGTATVFLVGLMTWRTGGFEVRQFLAREPGEERAVLAATAELIARKEVLITFNGRFFDWPCLVSRSAACRITLSPPSLHLDLLQLARRLWRRDLPDHRLQTLEVLVCRRYRQGDLPSREVPAAYQDFLRRGEITRLRAVLRHNLMDVLSLADLLAAMLLGRNTLGE